MLIFAIDDEELVLEASGKEIKKAVPDAEVVAFNRAKAALDAIKEGQRPDVVFSDIEMPGITGLELAIKTKELSPSTKIIFVTGYSEYAIEAFKIKAHGYLLKPLTVQDIQRELDYIPKATVADQDKLEVRCFGHFDVYWKGEPVIFSRKQAKELFAYLIDREGAACNTGEIALALWQEGGSDNKAEQNRIRVIINDLKNTLKEIGMEQVLIREHREIAIRKDLIDCDYYRMLEGDVDALNEYKGKYMSDYSWAEMRNGSIQFDQE